MRTSPRSPPPWLTAESSFSESTGSTQGIRLRISPPATASSRTIHRSIPVCRPEAGAAICAADSASTCSAERAPSTTVKRISRPARAAAAVWRRQSGDAGECRPAVGADPVVGRAEGPPVRSLDKDVGPRQRRVGRQLDLERLGDRPADRGGGGDADRPVGAGARDQGAEPVDQRRLGRGDRRPFRQPKRELGDMGNADVVTRQVWNPGPESERPARFGDGGRNRKNHLVAVAQGLQVEDRESLRRRPGQRGLVEVPRACPIGVRRETGISRRPPVDLPALVHPEMDTEAQGRTVADGIGLRDQTNGALLVGPPLGSRGPRLAGENRRQRQQEDPERRGEARSLFPIHVVCTIMVPVDPGLYFERRSVCPRYRIYRSAMRGGNSINFARGIFS